MLPVQGEGFPGSSLSTEGWLETPSLSRRKIKAGFAGCPMAAGGHSSAGELSQQLGVAPNQQSPEQGQWILVL